MFKSLNAKKIHRELSQLEGKEREAQRESFVRWFREFRPQLSEPNELQELKVVLGLATEGELLAATSFRELVPDGWLKDVLDLQHEAEAPSPFYFLAAVTVMSNLVGRRCMIDRGTHTVGLDTSALLISPAGRGRRTTACDFVVYDIGERAGLPIIADSFTFEAMGDALAESAEKRSTKDDPRCFNPRALIYAGEMATLLGKGSYADSIIPKLTDVIGKTSRFNWRTVKRGGNIAFINPCVNALFTSAPDWLTDNIPPVVFGGGMLSRFLMCVRDLPEQVVTWGGKIPESDLETVAGRLRKIAQRRGGFNKPDGEAFKWYDNWYQKHTKRTLHGEIPDLRMAPYFSRKHDHLLRLTALLTLAAEERSLGFSVDRFEQALRILDWLEVDIPKAYATMALSPLAAAQRSVIEALDRAGGYVERARLHRMVYRHLPLKEQFDSVMTALMEMKLVQVRKDAFGKGLCYRLVKSFDD